MTPEQLILLAKARRRRAEAQAAPPPNDVPPSDPDQMQNWQTDTVAPQSDLDNPALSGQPLNVAGWDTGVEMSPGVTNALAGAGKSVADTGRGLEQIFAPSAPLQQEIDDSRRLDAPLMDTGAGMAGNIAGNLAQTYVGGKGLQLAGEGASAAPALAKALRTMGQSLQNPMGYKQAVGAGAALGAVQPVAEEESRSANAAMGAAGGLAGNALASGIGRVVQPVRSTLSPSAEALAREAEKAGIPLDAAAKTGSKALGYVESAFDSLPFTAGQQARKHTAQDEAFTRAVLKHAGIDADRATPAVLQAQKDALGRQFEQIAARNPIDFNHPQVMNDIAALQQEAAGKLTGPDLDAFTRTLDNVLNDVDSSGMLTGQKYQAWREPLRRESKKPGALSLYMSKLRGVLDDGFANQAGAGPSGAEVTQARRQWGNLKTTRDALGAGGQKASEDLIDPAKLAAALRSSVGKQGRALGQGDLDTLVRIGDRFLKPLPDSGTAQRAMYQRLMTGGGTMGTALVAGGLTPGAVGAGATALALPKALQKILQSDTGQKYLTNKSLQDLSPEMRRFVEALRGTTTMGGAVLGLEAPR